VAAPARHVYDCPGVGGSSDVWQRRRGEHRRLKRGVSGMANSVRRSSIDARIKRGMVLS